MYIRELSAQLETGATAVQRAWQATLRRRRVVEMSKVNLNYSIMVDKYSYASPPIVLLFGKIYFFLATISQRPQVSLIVSPLTYAVPGMPAPD
jgi:hypothetical protein